MVVSEVPMVRLARFGQSSKAESPMELTVSGMAMVVREVQLKKADRPMVVRVLGRVTVLRLDSRSKARLAMAMTGRFSMVWGMRRSPWGGVERRPRMTMPSVLFA